MFRCDELIWSLTFPFVYSVMMWFSIDLALLVRAGGGRRRRQNAVRAVEQLVLRAPAIEYDDGNGGVRHRSNSNNRNASQEASYGRSSAAIRRPDHYRRRLFARSVEVPAAMRIATRATTRRAVVVVGGDFARSPRMQYHASSLAKSGLFDEVVLVGLDCGNHLSEALMSSGAAAPETFITGEAPSDVEAAVQSWLRRPKAGSGCNISTRYLTKPPSPPEWFQYVFPLRSLHWLACTVYRVVVFTLLFSWQITRATAIRVNAHGQLLLTDVIIVQSPPAVPFVLVVKYLVRPLSFLYSCIVYYCFIVPASWMNRGAMEDIRTQCHVRSCIPQSVRASSSVRRQEDINNNDSSKKDDVKRYRVFWPSLIVDWHNFGYTILESARRPPIISSLYRFLELGFCAGDANVTVSAAMKQALLSTAIRAKRDGKSQDVEVLYDVAPSFFSPASRQTFIERVALPITEISSAASSAAAAAETTGEHHNGGHTGWGIAPPPSWVMDSASGGVDRAGARRKRGLMVVGSTSWTEEDDYSVLVEALQRLDHRLCHEYKYVGLQSPSRGTSTPPPPASTSSSHLLDVWVLITGKGPARRRFENAVRAANLSSHVVVSTVYLQSYQQYSITLGAADVGLCLHYSTSGLDLPMKGVDMLGCGLPIMALDYPAIGELVHGHHAQQLSAENASAPATPNPQQGSVVPCEKGWLFTNATELEALLALFVGLQSATSSSGSNISGAAVASSGVGIGGSGGGSGSMPRASSGESVLEDAQQRIRSAPRIDWDTNWMSVMRPLLEKLL